MWPILLNMTRDECRQTLRRLELEAYSNMMSVFRAQGALEDNRKKLLEELRAVLHISRDRHSAEARRVSNDELLATIADQLAGPNTGLGWISEGRRLVPLLPRGIAQTMYTEVADKAAESTAAENRDIKKKVEAEKLAPKPSEEEVDVKIQAGDNANYSNEPMDEIFYPPIAMEDQSSKVWETELVCRKRKVPESNSMSEELSSPVKSTRNIPANSNQKHLNLSQIYSRFSQTTDPETRALNQCTNVAQTIDSDFVKSLQDLFNNRYIRSSRAAIESVPLDTPDLNVLIPNNYGKSTGHSKHSYNQVSKVSTSKSQSHRSTHHKPRAHKQKNAMQTKTQRKSQENIPRSSSQQFNSGQLHPEYTKSPSTFQSSFSQTVLGGKSKSDYIDEIKPKVISSLNMATDTSTMPQVAQQTTISSASESQHVEDPSSYSQSQGTAVSKQNASGKHCHLIIKKRNEVPPEKKVQISDFKIIQKPSEGVKVISNRQVVVAPSSAQKALNTTSKLVTTKVVSSVPRSRSTNSPLLSKEKMIVVSKSSADNRLPSTKMVITSAPMTTPNKELLLNSSITNKTSEALTPKGIPATDLKVSAKTFVVNPKSGQKMVVVPAKGGKECQIPLFHFKGIPTTMKLVSVASQPVPISKPTAMTKPTVVSSLPSNTKIIGVEPIKTANLADIVPVKGLTPVSAPKITNPIVRPVTKGNVIVVQKGATIGKAVTFTKNGNDMSKIIMGKNVNQLLQANKPDKVEPGKGNVIVLELNNEQSGRTTTMSEILDSRSPNIQRTDQSKKATDMQITQDTPVLFESQINDDACNTSSLDSAVSIEDIRSIDESNVSLTHKDDENKSNFNKENIGIKDDTSIADWEMELDTTVSRKGKDPVDKLNSLHLDLGMSSDSESEYIIDGHKIKSKHSPQGRIQSATPTGVDNERYNSSALSLATRTLLSQLHDDGSSSNDSSFALRAKCSDKFKANELKIDKTESEALSKAKAKLSEKVAEAKSQQKRIDVYSTAITTSDINLDSFSYLDEGLMAGDDEFASDSKREMRQTDALDDQLSRLLGEDSANSTDSQTVSESLSLSKS